MKNELKWIEHRDKETNKLNSVYLLSNYKIKSIIKYEIKFQFDSIDKNKIECYILTEAIGSELPHYGKYDISFEGNYYEREKLVRVYFNLEKAKEEAEKLCRKA